MEKPTHSHSKTKNNFLKFLPKAANSVYFQNPPFSPIRDKRSDHRIKPHGAAGKGFSGPIISIIPDEARRRSKNGCFHTQEPTSPKISCMGQIKHKKETMKKLNDNYNFNSGKRDPKPPSTPQVKKPSAIKRLLRGSSKLDQERRRSDASVYDKQPLSADRAPSLSQLKRFASGRETLSSIDWSSQFTPAGADRRNLYSEEEDEEQEEIITPISAAIIVGPARILQERKEVCIWKRRTMDPPKPLQLNMTVRTG